MCRLKPRGDRPTGASSASKKFSCMTIGSIKSRVELVWNCVRTEKETSYATRALSFLRWPLRGGDRVLRARAGSRGEHAHALEGLSRAAQGQEHGSPGQREQSHARAAPDR